MSNEDMVAIVTSRGAAYEILKLVAGNRELFGAKPGDDVVDLVAKKLSEFVEIENNKRESNLESGSERDKTDATCPPAEFSDIFCSGKCGHAPGSDICGNCELYNAWALLKIASGHTESKEVDTDTVSDHEAVFVFFSE